MHLELLVPGLLTLPGPARAPALERLLRRGRVRRGERASMEAWLQEGFRLPALPAGALSVLGSGGEPGDASWARADPVHLRLLRDRIVIVPADAVGLTAAEAEALSAALRAHFSERLDLVVHTTGRWSVRLAGPLALPAMPPLDMAGRPAAPGGAGDALLTEIQMVLHAHEANAARESQGQPPINSLWLWGEGALPKDAHATWLSATAGDPLVHGLARAAGMRSRAPSPAADWLERAPGEGRHLVVLDHLRAPAALGDVQGHAEALAALEREWFAPVLAALQAGGLGMVTVHVPDGARALWVETIRGDLRRFWRRPRPLAAWASEGIE
ncbi:MAG TPA: hypothetical protein VG873_15670 [Burkholderiales bacterium]|nr:hypothetical protein [Burkholderiales bacterium]